MQKREFWVVVVVILGFVLLVPSLDDAVSGMFGKSVSFGGGKGLGFTPQSVGFVKGFGTGGEYPTGYTALWKFDDDPNNGVEDSSSYNVDGDCTGHCPDVVQGQFGDAYDFSGNDYIDFGENDFGIPDSDELTIAFWLNPSSISGTQDIIERSQYVRPFQVQLNGGKIRFKLRTSITTPVLDSTASLQTGTWYHVAVTYRDGERIIYIDGDVDNQDGFSGVFSSSNDDTHIGNQPVSNDLYLYGILDEFIIYNMSLSESDIENIMSGSGGGLVQKPKPCKLGSAEWSVTESIEGYPVGLYVYALPGTSCNGESVSLNVLNTGNDPLDAVFNGDVAIGSWDTEDGTWVFEAILNSNPSSKVQSGNTLYVPDCGNNVTESPEVCDGVDLNGKNCSDFPPYDNGTLDCLNDCSDYDKSDCTMQGSPTEYIIADHNAVRDFDNIPAYWLDQARDLVVHWGHTSHGSQYYSGMNFTIDHVNATKYNARIQEDDDNNRIPDELPPPQTPNALRIWNEPTWPADFWSVPYELERTRTILATGIFNVSGWSWCGQVGSCGETGGNTGLNCTDDQYIYDYLSIFNNFSKDFPNTKIIFLTGHRSQGITSGPNERRRNDIIRNFTVDVNGILYDFADIESWDYDGVYHANESDYCHWCEDYCNGPGSNTNECINRPLPEDTSNGCTNELRCSWCPHAHGLNCIIKAKAWWWLMARLAGWDGTW